MNVTSQNNFRSENIIGKRQLIFLGTGTSVGVPMIGCDCKVCLSDNPKWKRTRSSVLIESPEGRLLIDTTPDLREQFLREKIPYAHAVLYTHHHVDHVMGLDEVRVFSKHTNQSVNLFCDPKVEQFIRSAFSYAFDPVVQKFPSGGIPKLSFQPITRPSLQVMDHEIIPIDLKHGRFDVLGFRFGNLAYCTDVNHIPEESWEKLENLDVLILDALRHEPHPTHFSLEEALAVTERLKPKQTYFTHISCRLDPEKTEAMLPGNVQLAYDGLRIEF